MSIEDDLQQAARAIAEADALYITSGAGMGVDSGLPDFRGTEGFWRAYPAIGRLKIRFEEMANPSWFQRDPGLAWGFYGHRLNLYRRLSGLKEDSDLEAMTDEMKDRFGPFPQEVSNLLSVMSVRLHMKRAGISRLDAGSDGLLFTFYGVLL